MASSTSIAATFARKIKSSSSKASLADVLPFLDPQLAAETL
jgi:hypothetical protein